jgi:hypothetical protein
MSFSWTSSGITASQDRYAYSLSEKEYTRTENPMATSVKKPPEGGLKI